MAVVNTFMLGFVSFLSCYLLSPIICEQLRVDGVLMRLRDTRMFCRMQNGSTTFSVVIRERNIKEDTFDALALVCVTIFLQLFRGFFVMLHSGFLGFFLGFRGGNSLQSEVVPEFPACDAGSEPCCKEEQQLTRSPLDQPAGVSLEQCGSLY